MEIGKVTMKKILLILALSGTVFTNTACAQNWVAPALIGGVVGYTLASPRYYYGPYGYTTPPPVIIQQQQPVIVQQQAPVIVNNQQVCEEKAMQDNQGRWHNGTFCFTR
jgi:hypothetical protein